MDWQNIIEIIAAITGISGVGIGVKTLEQQITVNQNQFDEVKMHIMNIETKIDLMFMTINNNNTNEINFAKEKETK